MADKQDERREVRAIVRTYKKDGEDKNVYATVGTAWVSEHGSKISLQIESLPIAKDWDGRLFINKPYEPKGGKSTVDIVVSDIGDEPINLNDIPF